MRRTRKDSTTKVWHNPDINTFTKRGGGGGNGGVARVATESPEDRRSAKQHRAALEALFAPKREPEADDAKAKSGPSSKSGNRIVLAPAPPTDARAGERQKLLNRLLIAEGRPSVSKAADAFLAAGFTFPEEQDVYLQLLEHTREDHVLVALGQLDTILAGELPKRRAVLESRLRRIEQFAEDTETREAAAHLRRRVSGRGASASSTAPSTVAPLVPSTVPTAPPAVAPTALPTDPLIISSTGSSIDESTPGATPPADPQ